MEYIVDSRILIESCYSMFLEELQSKTLYEILFHLFLNFTLFLFLTTRVRFVELNIKRASGLITQIMITLTYNVAS